MTRNFVKERKKHARKF